MTRRYLNLAKFLILMLAAAGPALLYQGYRNHRRLVLGDAPVHSVGKFVELRRQDAPLDRGIHARHQTLRHQHEALRRSEHAGSLADDDDCDQNR